MNEQAQTISISPEIINERIEPRAPTQDDVNRLAMLYRARPDKWLQATTGEHVWWRQQEIMRSVAVNPRTAVASCNSAGKSFLAARLVVWFLTMYKPSAVITTAPSNRQIEKILWREVMNVYHRAKARNIILGDPPLTTEWKFDHERYAIGFAPRDYDPNAFQGFHSRNMLVIVDEAAEIDEDIYAGVNSVVRGSNYRILLIGNPTAISGYFYNAFKTPGWTTFNISAFMSPNVVEGREVVPGIISARDVADAENEYGRDSWQWRVFIEGKFPDKEDGTLIALDWLAKASKKNANPELTGLQVEVGADIARFGSDKVVFCAQRGFHAFALEDHKHKSTMESCGLLAQFVERVGATVVRIDTVGVGAGVLDRYREICPKHVRVVEMIGNNKPNNPLKYTNAVTEWWDHLANLLKGGQATGPIFDDKHIVGDLVSRKARMLSNGLIMLESKQDVKKRIHRSPDHGDAVVMAFATKIEGVGTRKRLKTAWARHIG